MTEQDFGDEVLLMHDVTHQTLALNPPAGAIWSLLEFAPSLSELIDVFAEARPGTPRHEHAAAVEDLLRVLGEGGFAVSESGTRSRSSE